MPLCISLQVLIHVIPIHLSKMVMSGKIDETIAANLRRNLGSALKDIDKICVQEKQEKEEVGHWKL